MRKNQFSGILIDLHLALHFLRQRKSEPSRYTVSRPNSVGESLLVHIDKDIDLPKEAASGLADLMVRMHLVCERVFK